MWSFRSSGDGKKKKFVNTRKAWDGKEVKHCDGIGTRALQVDGQSGPFPVRHPTSPLYSAPYIFFRPMKHSGRREVKLRHVEEINRC